MTYIPSGQIIYKPGFVPIYRCRLVGADHLSRVTVSRNLKRFL